MAEVNERLGVLLSSPEQHPLVVACTDRIISRAITTMPVSEDAPTQQVLNNPNKYMDQVDFWSSLYSNMLVYGFGLVVRYRENLWVAQSSNVSRAPGKWEIHLLNRFEKFNGSNEVGFNNTIKATIPNKDVCLLRLRSGQDKSLLGIKPLHAIRNELAAYSSAITLLDAYNARAHSLGYSVEVTKEVQPDNIQELFKDAKRYIQGDGSFKTINVPDGLTVKATGANPTPAFNEIISESTRAVARFFGVPAQLLGVKVSGDRDPVAELDANLVRDSVLPLLQVCESALSRFFETSIEYPRDKLALPSAVGLADLAGKYALAGVLTTNEIRELIGRPPIAGGDVPPDTAGAPERESE